MKKVSVTGATGKIGSQLVSWLAAYDIAVRAFVRNAEKAAPLTSGKVGARRMVER